MTDRSVDPPIWDLYERRTRGEMLEYDRDAESQNGVAWALVPWDIRNESRPWTKEEIGTRYLRMLMEIKDEIKIPEAEPRGIHAPSLPNKPSCATTS